MEHRKLDALMSPMEKLARVAAAGVSSSRAQQTSPSGAISLDNADGTRTIIGEVSNGEDNPSYTMATHVGDTTPPGIPTGITATSKSGVVVVEWDGTLTDGIPDDFYCVRVYLDGTELGALTEAGSVASAKLEANTTHQVTAKSEDDCCLPDGTPAHNVSDATQAISVTVAKDASEVMADIDEQIEGVEQEIADFKANTYTKAQTDKKVQDLDDEISTELTTNYYNKTQIDTSYATKTLVSQTKEEIELSASQTYATKGAGNPNLSPLTAHDTQDRYNASTNPDGYWRADVRGYENIEDGWVHVIRNASTATQWGQQFQTMPLPILKPSTKYTLLMEYRNVSVTGTLRAWPLYASSDQFVYPPETTAFDVDRDMVVRAQLMTKDSFEGVVGGVDVRHALYPPGGESGSCSYDLRLSVYECELDGNGDPIPYEGAYKPYVTDQQALGKTYATNSELTVGLDGIRQEVAAEYQTIDGMGAYSTTAEMNTAIQTSATGIEQSVAATYSTKQATADAIAAIQVGGRNLITLANTRNGSTNGGTGAIIGSNASNMERCTDDLLECVAGETYCLQVWGDAGTGEFHPVLHFFDASGTQITAGVATGDNPHYALLRMEAPDGAATMRARWRSYGNGYAKLEKGTTPTDYTAAPEDLEARPNLVPYGTHDFADVYNATTNPDGYWQTTPQSQYFTQLDDGWVHVHIDNSAGTGTPVPNSLRPRQVDGLEGGELVTLLLEVRNNHSTTTGTATTSRFYVQAASGAQLYGNAPQTANLTNDSISYPLREGETFVKRMVYVTDTTHLPASGVYGEAFRLGFRTEAGVNLDFELRASLYRGGYEGGYVPYSIEDTTLSKTYTKSSTFTQTVNGLDGRITTTEDGLAIQQTLIRQYAGGVLVAYTGNTVGALVNAAGQYDIVSLTWADGEPTVGDTLASFTATDLLLGLQAENASISLLGTTGELFATTNWEQLNNQWGIILRGYSAVGMFASTRDRRRDGISIERTVRRFITTDGPRMIDDSWLDINAPHISIMGGMDHALTIGQADPDLDGSGDMTENPRHADLYVHTDGVVDLEALSIGRFGRTNEQTQKGETVYGNSIEGIYTGSKVVNPAGAAYATLFTSTEAEYEFGRAPNAGKDIVVLTNGDPGAYQGQMTAALTGGNIRAYFSPTKTGGIRVNYIVFLMK